MSPRLSLALDGGGLVLPERGTIAVFHPRAGYDLSALPRDRVRIVQPFRPDFDAFAAAGFDCEAEVGGPYAAVLICLPRAKALARSLIATAAATTSGPVIVDGAKTDGVDSLYRDCRKRGEASAPIAKSHGKLFWICATPAAFSDWLAPEGQDVEGFVTAPGVFSADGVDPASRALTAALPAHLGRHVADLGGGWGVLSAHCLADAGIETLDLVEADHIALDCARRNLSDPRVRLHWADATRWTAETPLDAVVMNPPFHTGRAADPSLGREFIAAAARNLAPSGDLWMVANRHLPYETALSEHFARFEEVGGTAAFKVLRASRPIRRKGSRTGH